MKNLIEKNLLHQFIFTGVHFEKERGMWVAQITFQKVNHNLGRFKTIEEAINARKAAEE